MSSLRDEVAGCYNRFARRVGEQSPYSFVCPTPGVTRGGRQLDAGSAPTRAATGDGSTPLLDGLPVMILPHLVQEHVKVP